MVTLAHFFRPNAAHPGVRTGAFPPTPTAHVAGDNDYAESASHLFPQPQPPALSHAQRNSPPAAASADMHPPPLDGAEERSFLEIVAPRTVVFRGLGQDVDTAVLAGTLVLHLAESTDLRDITLEFTGKAKLPAPPSPYLKSQHGYVVHTYETSFMPQGEKKQSRTFKAGRHTFPFSIELEPYLPSSLQVTHSTPAIAYKLRATAVRPPLFPNLTSTWPVDVLRAFGPNSLEYQQTLEVENTWPGKIMYSLTLPHKAWAAGDTIMALVKFAPLAKGVCINTVCTSITETVKYGGSHGVEMKKEVCSARHIFKPPTTGSSSDEASSRPHSSHAASGEQSPPHSQAQEASNSVQVAESVDVTEPAEDEVVAKVELKIPPWVCPSHAAQPIMVTHRVRWIVIIRNADGHFSELRCSLPIHVLSRHLLDEAVQASAPTRRLLFGIDDLVLPEAEQVELPSYSAHVQDRVPNAVEGWPLDFGPLTNGSNAASTSPDGYFPPTSSRSPSNPSTPARPPHGLLPDETDVVAPLPRTSSFGAIAAAAFNSSALSVAFAAVPPSMPSSRPSTRPPSPEPSSFPSSSMLSSDSSHSIHAPTASRKPLFSLGGISMKPLTPFASRGPSRAPSRPSTPPGHHHDGPVPVQFDRALQAALSTVPDYDTASRGFALGGVPPLSSAAGLPSYDEASRSLSEGDIASRAPHGRRHVAFIDESPDDEDDDHVHRITSSSSHPTTPALNTVRHFATAGGPLSMTPAHSSTSSSRSGSDNGH
ncbi:hypothetical protein EXIGLDRAFT_722273 [Exidia glandulosa HHB12029]|uniref:Arrestin C-terminal-like domain-containing protein n=1 Tax=Exidia glandulosa HHB12029 TaxID=1314781 RepID=A0A165N4S8_EXIGL|nr:hypothetical protein EXIGLDRAFT_722273 [Exidia glandulosa HHB12029]